MTEKFVQIIDDGEDCVQVLGYEPSSSEEGEIEVTSFELDGESAVIIDIDDESFADTTNGIEGAIDSDIDTFANTDTQ